MNTEFWKNRNVFITGHTGFKGGWISLLLDFGLRLLTRRILVDAVSERGVLLPLLPQLALLLQLRPQRHDVVLRRRHVRLDALPHLVVVGDGARRGEPRQGEGAEPLGQRQRAGRDGGQLAERWRRVLEVLVFYTAR